MIEHERDRTTLAFWNDCLTQRERRQRNPAENEARLDLVSSRHLLVVRAQLEMV